MVVLFLSLSMSQSMMRMMGRFLMEIWPSFSTVMMITTWIQSILKPITRNIF